jgi:uncharacterized coiled-coil protein SlyX
VALVASKQRGDSMSDFKASIGPDDILERPLDELSATDLLRLLGSDRVAGVRNQLADKKKYELWVDETSIGRLPVGSILDRLRTEKKKLELEIQMDRALQVDLISLLQAALNESNASTSATDFQDLLRRIVQKLLESSKDLGRPPD